MKFVISLKNNIMPFLNYVAFLTILALYYKYNYYYINNNENVTTLQMYSSTHIVIIRVIILYVIINLKSIEFAFLSY